MPCHFSFLAGLAGSIASIGVLGLATGVHAQDAHGLPDGGARAKHTFDVKAELSWARREWPEELDKVKLAYPSQRLLSWVPAGKTVKAFIFAEHYDCAPVELSRCETKGCGYLVGRIFRERPSREDGRMTRAVYAITLDDRISDEHDCVTFERQDRHGQWRAEYDNCLCAGHHPPERVLSFVDSAKAVYGGEPLVLDGVFSGPKAWLPCARGGERPCDTCKQVALEVEVDGADPAIVVSGAEESEGHKQSCHEPCPEMTNPQIDRLRTLRKHIRRRDWDVTSASGLPSLWRPAEEPSAVYKSSKKCLREHPIERR